jgi:hypothetical protein
MSGMSWPVIFVLVEGEDGRRRADIRFSRWNAPTVYADLAGGPRFTEQVIRRLDRPGNLGGGDAGVLLDLSRRQLLFHFQPALAVHEGLARTRTPAGLGTLEFMRVLRLVLAAVWEGWQVTWAWQEDLDLARYLATGGTSGTSGTSPADAPTWRPGASLGVPTALGAGPGATTETLVTIRDHQQLRCWLTASPAAQVLQCGASLGTVRPAGQADPAGRPVMTGTPGGGVHVDLDAQRADWWTAGTTRGWDLAGLASDFWGDDWQVTFHQDRYQDVAARCHPELAVPRPDWMRGLAALRENLDRPATRHRLGEDSMDLLAAAMAELERDLHAP